MSEESDFRNDPYPDPVPYGGINVLTVCAIAIVVILGCTLATLLLLAFFADK